MRPTYLLALVLLPLMSCEKDEIVSDDDAAFVPGEVLMGTKETTTISQAFALVNSRALGVLSIAGPLYTSALPADSLGSIERTLNAKPYINDGVWKASVYRHAITGALTVTVRLMNMNLANQQDWLTTVQKLQLQEQPTTTSYHLKVPVGQEKSLVRELQQQNEVRWAELNNIVHIMR